MPLSASIFGVAELCIPKSCPDQIPNGALSESCSANVGTTCDFICNLRYSKVYRTRIKCETSTNWGINPHALCEHNSLQQCPYEVPNGDLDLTCKRRPGDTCTFSCREGYRTPKQNTVSCDSMLHWSQSLQSACKDILCPLTIPNGYVRQSCSRQYGSYCYKDDYWCDTGYVKPPAPPGLKCNASGQWQWSKHQGQPCFKEEDMCPSLIRNGKIVWHCERQAGSHCTYSCDPGCAQNRSTVWLNCGEDGRWNEDTDLLCTDCRQVTTTASSLCPASISRGRIVSSCDRRPYSSCYFTCDPGCSHRATKLTCKSDLHWTFESYACDCPESSNPSFSSPTGNAGSAVIGGVIGAVVLVMIVVAVIVVIARNRKRHPSTTPCAVPQCNEYQTNVPGRPSVGGIPLGVTSPTYGRTSPNYGLTSPNYANPSQDTYYSSLQPQQNNEGNTYAQLQPPLGNNNFDGEPPAYSSIAPVVAPREDPPPYEQVTSNPVDFKV